jgi:protein-disulfide isomerase
MVLKEKTKNSTRDRQQMIIIGVVAVAVIVSVIAIVISGTLFNPGAGSIDYTNVPMGRTEDGGFILGDPNAPVTIVAFEDFLCPHCQDYQSVINKFIQEQVIPGKARFEYRFLPAIDPTYSFLMADMVECSDILEPGSFWKAHDVMFGITSRSRFGTGTAKEFSEAMGLDYSKMLECSKDEADQIETDRKLGDSLGVSGTPTVFIRYGDNEPVLQSPPPSYEQLAALVGVAAGMPQN